MAILVSIGGIQYGINIPPNSDDYTLCQAMTFNELIRHIQESWGSLNHRSYLVLKHWANAGDVHWQADKDSYAIRKQFDSLQELIDITRHASRAHEKLLLEEKQAYNTIADFCDGSYAPLVKKLTDAIVKRFCSNRWLKLSFAKHWFGQIADVNWETDESIKASFQPFDLECLYRFVATLVNVHKPIHNDPKNGFPLGETPCGEQRALPRTENKQVKAQRDAKTSAFFESHTVTVSRRKKGFPVLTGDSGTTMDILFAAHALSDGEISLEEFRLLTRLIQAFFHIAPKHFPTHTAIEIAYAHGVMMKHFAMVPCPNQECDKMYELLALSQDKFTEAVDSTEPSVNLLYNASS